jgi:hypothetical protein
VSPRCAWRPDFRASVEEKSLVQWLQEAVVRGLEAVTAGKWLQVVLRAGNLNHWRLIRALRRRPSGKGRLTDLAIPVRPAWSSSRAPGAREWRSRDHLNGAADSSGRVRHPVGRVASSLSSRNSILSRRLCRVRPASSPHRHSPGPTHLSPIGNAGVGGAYFGRNPLLPSLRGVKWPPESQPMPQVASIWERPSDTVS